MTEFHGGGVWRPARSFHSLEAFVLPEQPRAPFDVVNDGLRYSCILTRLDKADRLFVSICSSVHRDMLPPPGFERHRWAKQFGGHLLAVSDPTLYMSSTIEASCCLGNKDQDVIPGLVQLAEKVAAGLGLSPERIVYWAHSAAAFGAGMAAVYSGRSRAVLCNGLVDVPAYRHHATVKEGLRVFGFDSFDEAVKAYPNRVRVSTAIQAARAEGRQPKILLVQNTVDSYYYNRQYLPFCKIFDISEHGGTDPTGCLRTMPFDHPSGHSLEPPEVVDLILKHPFLTEEVLERERSEPSSVPVPEPSV